MEEPVKPRGAAYDQLQLLVKALEAGNYDARPMPLTQGSEFPGYTGKPLQVESLELTMRCVTFEDPSAYRMYAARYRKLAKVCRFFRLHSWAHMFELAEGNSEKLAKDLMIKLAARKERFNYDS